MKLAFSTSGETLESALDPRFGRAPKFLIYNLQTQSFQVIDNQQNLEAVQGAGIQSAQNIAKIQVNALITGHCGPKAFRVLQAAGIKVFNTDAPTVAEALERYSNGQLSESNSADVSGHW